MKLSKALQTLAPLTANNKNKNLASLIIHSTYRNWTIRTDQTFQYQIDGKTYTCRTKI